jgi:Tfp pilus assembly PilM family ATPase
MACIIGIDIGSWAIKATVLQGGFNRFEVEGQYTKKVARTPLSADASAAQFRAVEALLDEIEPGERVFFGACFPIHQASMRSVSMPFTDKTQIAQTLEFEVESLVPYDLEDMVMTHRIAGTNDKGSDVIAALAPTQEVRALLISLTEAGADPKSLVIDGDLLGSCGNSGTEAIIDIGHSRTLLTISRDGATVFSRGITIGGEHLTTALADAHGIPFEEAEHRKHSTTMATRTVAQWDDDEATHGTEAPLVDGQADAEIIRGALAPLIASLRTSLIGYEDTSGHDIDRIRLTGGTSNLSQVTTLFKAEFGVSVSLLAGETGGGATPNIHVLSALLADRAAGTGSGTALELRTGEFKYRGDMANRRMLFYAGAAAVVISVIGGLGYFSYQYNATQQRLAALDTQIADTVSSVYGDGMEGLIFETPDDALLAIQERTQSTTDRIALLGSIVDGSPPVVSTLTQLSNAMPEPSTARIDVRELNLSRQNISFKAETDGYDAAANIEASLAAHQRFKRAKKGDEKKTRTGIQFTVSIPLGEAEPGEES